MENEMKKAYVSILLEGNFVYLDGSGPRKMTKEEIDAELLEKEDAKA
jgi:hypothetical protein